LFLKTPSIVGYCQSEQALVSSPPILRGGERGLNKFCGGFCAAARTDILSLHFYSVVAPICFSRTLVP
jgi:hypothetical protein